jgi:hypothetical protein
MREIRVKRLGAKNASVAMDSGRVVILKVRVPFRGGTTEVKLTTDFIHDDVADALAQMLVSTVRRRS